MSASGAIQQRNQDATVYVGQLHEDMNDELLWELMLQAGPVVNVHMPKDKISGKHQSFGFVEFRAEEDAEYAIKILNMIKLVGKPIKVSKAAQDKKFNEVGANVFVGNLDPDVDEKLLYDTFSAFGGISQTPKIMRDNELGSSKGYGFISFDSFEGSDSAIECMNGQYLCNRPIVVQYAFKKETPGERHGSQAERLMAASSGPMNRFKPHTIFSGGVGDTTVTLPPPMPPQGQMYDMSSMMLGGGMQGMGMMPPPPMGYNSYGQGMIPPPPPPPMSMMLPPPPPPPAQY